MHSRSNFAPKVCFNVDANGRSVWTGTGGGAASGKPAAEKKEAAPVVASGDHILTDVETTEAFLNKHGIKFKVSAHLFCQINLSR